MYNIISLLWYVFSKVSTIFSHGYKSRNCQKTRSIHAGRKLVNPNTLSSPRSAGHKPCATISNCAGISVLPQAPLAFRSPKFLSVLWCQPPNSAWRSLSFPQVSWAGLLSPPTLQTAFAAIAPSSGSSHHLLLCAETKDTGWRGTKVSKGSGPSILMSYIFAV